MSTPTAKLREQVEAYFSSLNYPSSRIMQDVSCIRAEHSQDWDRISEEQKTEIVWERLVCPEIKEKYNYYPPEYSEVEVFPVIQLNTGDKMVTDEEHANGNARSTKAGCWRDEHSAPFSWETQSQLNVRISGSVDEVDGISAGHKSERPSQPKEEAAPNTAKADNKPVDPSVAEPKLFEVKASESRLSKSSKSQESVSSIASRGSSNPSTPSGGKGGRRRAPTPPRAPPPDPPRPRLALSNPSACATPVAAPSVAAAVAVTSVLPMKTTDAGRKHPSSKPPAPPVPKAKAPDIPNTASQGPTPATQVSKLTSLVLKPASQELRTVVPPKPLPPTEPATGATDTRVPPPRRGSKSQCSTDTSEIPKTGFDFLDNW